MNSAKVQSFRKERFVKMSIFSKLKSQQDFGINSQVDPKTYMEIQWQE